MKKIYKYFILIPTVLILSACNSDSSLQSNLNPEERERMEMERMEMERGRERMEMERMEMEK